jgi:hypothetical protein
MDPITLVIMSILAVTAVAVIIELMILTVEWLAESFNSMKTGDVNEIGFTVKHALESGKYEVVQGVFNKSTEEIVSSKLIRAEKLDENVEAFHRQNEVVLYS